MEIITANSNPKIKNINKLNKNAAFRKEEQVFIVEGSRMFLRCYESFSVSFYL